ncbi:MAG: CRISPR-associated endonuclease Cas2 [Clostridia bacterium]|jgi:CRISPR-associated protein Cas2
MRIFVFFDLPVKTMSQRRKATRFRNDLLKEGFYMMQYSVYVRVCHNIESCYKYMSRVKKMAPKVGCIRILPITEKQHQDMVIVTGKRKEEEKEVREYQLSFF